MIRTEVGYAGGSKVDPTYRSLENHSETIEIEYDPDIVSYRELLNVFWEENSAVRLPYSRQYYSIIFYHNEEQKKLAEESYETRLVNDTGTVMTEIVPYTVFYPAEMYHQKYYLQQEDKLLNDIRGNYDSLESLLASTTAARLNGYIGSYGDKETLNRDIDNYGLSEDGKKRLLEVAKRGLLPACGVSLPVGE